MATESRPAREEQKFFERPTGSFHLPSRPAPGRFLCSELVGKSLLVRDLPAALIRSSSASSAAQEFRSADSLGVCCEVQQSKPS